MASSCSRVQRAEGGYAASPGSGLREAGPKELARGADEEQSVCRGACSHDDDANGEQPGGGYGIGADDSDNDDGDDNLVASGGEDSGEDGEEGDSVDGPQW